MIRGNVERLWCFALGAASMIVVPVAVGWLREKITGRASW
jgi:hypothetical protein